MTDTAMLAKRCRLFMQGTKRLYDGKRLSGCAGDMWFFELFHHLNDCADALEALPPPAPMPHIDTSNAPFHPPPDDKP